MKSLIRLGLSLAFGLSLLACSSEKDPKEPKIPPTPEAKVAFTLNLKAEGALSELRVADKDLDFGVGAKGKINLKLKKDEEYTAHCFIQNEEGDKCFYGTIRFVATSERTLVVKRGPKSEIKFYDAMAKDSKHTDASDKYYGFDKDSKTKWYFMAVFGGDKLSNAGSDKTKIAFSSLERLKVGRSLRRVKEGDVGTFDDIPYMSDWVELEIRKSGGDGNDKTEDAYTGGVAGINKTIAFKPFGSLLRIHLKNNLHASSIQVCALDVTSTIGALKVEFSLKGRKVTEGPAITEKYSDAACSLGTKLEDIPELASNAADDGYYLLWIYPNGQEKTGKDALAIQLRVQDKAKTASLNNLATMPTNYQVTKPLKAGRTYVVELTVDRPMMLLEILDEYNFVGQGNGHRATNHSNSEWQMYTHEQAKKIGTRSPGYHLPTQEEWEMLIGKGDMNFRDGANLPTEKTEDCISGSIFHTLSGGPTIAKYRKGERNEIAYATRFYGHGNGSATSTLYSAWRYELNKISDAEGYQLIIKSRYLGPGSTLRIDDIAKEEWWNTPDPTEVTRTLPFAGSYNDKGTDINNPYAKGKWGVYWTSTYEPDPNKFSIPHQTKPLSAGDKRYHIAGYRHLNAEGYDRFNGNIGTLKETQHAAVRLFKNY